MQPNSKAKLTQGSVTRTLVKLTLPMFVAMFAMVGFNVVDTYFVGQLGVEQLAAMGFTLAVVMAVQSVTMGLGMGTTAVIAKVIGQGDTHETQRLNMNAILLAVTVAVSIVIIGLSFMTPLFQKMGAEGQVLEYIRQYMSIWFFGLPLVIIPQVGNSGLRATGDTKTPAMIMVSVLTLNAILDPLLMFGLGPFPELNLRGAAVATVISQGTAMVIALNVLWRRKLLTLERQPIRHVLASWRRILTIAVPAGVTQMITPVSTGIVTAIVAGYGVAAVAGFGVASRLELFALMFVMAMGAGLVPFIGQNWGAGLKDRVGKGVRAAITFAAGWGGFVWLLSLLIGDSVAAMFNDNPVVIAVVTDYMRIVFPSYIFLGMVFTVTFSLNALHKPLKSLVLSVLRMFVLYVPLALAGSALWGLTGVWWAAFSANIVSGLAAIAWFRYVFRGMEMQSAEETGPRMEADIVSPEPEASPA